METIFRVDVIKRGFECGLNVRAAGRKESVNQLRGAIMRLIVN